MTTAKALLGLLFGVLFMQCWAFSVVSRPVAIGCCRYAYSYSSPYMYLSAPPAHVHVVAQRSSRSLFMSEPSDDDVEATSSQSPEASKDEVTKGESKAKGLSMVALFVKFCVVLAVKFITDVIIFPPLLLFRLIKNIYKWFASLVGKFTRTGVNGESSGSS